MVYEILMDTESKCEHHGGGDDIVGKIMVIERGEVQPQRLSASSYESARSSIKRQCHSCTRTA